MRTICAAICSTFLLLNYACQGQSGPGGIGNSTNNILWFTADVGVVAPTAGVQQWSDRSGNSNHAIQAVADHQPVLAPNAINGYPAVLFDNDQTFPDLLTVPDNSTLENMNGLTGFVVFRLNTGTPNSAPRGFFSKRVNPGSQNAYGWFLWQNGTNLSQHLDIDGSGDRATSSNTFSTGVNYVNSFMYHGATPSNTNDLQLFTSNVAVANRQETSTSIPNYSSNLHLGVLYGHTGTGANVTRFNGYIAEIIVYNQTLSTVQHLIVNNYLAAKYGTALGAADLYTMDEPTNGDFDHDVAGIGRSGSDVVNGSRGTGLLTIARSSGSITNNTYLLWGHDNGALGAWGVSDMHSSLQGRLERLWRVSEVNASGVAADVGNVDITFDLNGLGPVNPSDLRLVVDLNGDGVLANDLPISGAVDMGGGSYRFSNVSALTNGRRFTLGTTNSMTTPLPVELVTFTAVPEDERVALSWATATEQHSAHFLVQRSSELDHWTTIATVAAAGFSNSLNQYYSSDEGPPLGLSYYRLVQVDMDGTSTTYHAVAVEFRPTTALNVYPIPFEDGFTIALAQDDIKEIELFSPLGQRIPVLWQGSGPGLQVETGQLIPGRYLLQVRTTSGTLHRSIVKGH
ncbi:MAG: T9SS type A sorting domain-containing protein [Flavobacteriales bacterium]|nr:T9SS type A sorting domain-containing protein [Flavobacteriales bacterium]